MSCYLRHLHWLFEALDLEYDKANRARVDEAVRVVLDLPPDAGCPQVWAAVKGLPPADQAALPGRVGAVLGR
jgi:hypothetical protein